MDMTLLPGTNSLIQTIIAVWIARLTSTLSLLGSLAIIYVIYNDRKEKLRKTFHRLILMLSIFDVIHSSAYAIATLALPRSTQRYGAMGNDATCNAQGFLILFGSGSMPLYNAGLSLFFVLTIVHNVRTATFASKIEPIIHLVSILVPLANAVASLIIDEITSLGVVCFLTYSSSSTVVKTIWAVAFAVVFICGIINVFSMIIIYKHAFARLESVRRYSYSQIQIARRDTAKKQVLIQALQYLGAYISTWITPVFLYIFGIQDSLFLLIIGEILYPLQGFWNFLFYIRPKVNELRNLNSDRCWMRNFYEAIFGERTEVLQSPRQNINPLRELSLSNLSSILRDSDDSNVDDNINKT